jgi:Flp pilus assembly protein TadG
MSLRSGSIPGRRAAGVAIIWMLIMFSCLAALVSLAVDYGRVSLDKAELQLAADAAARHGAEGLPTGVELTNAQTAAAANIIEGSPVILLASDIVAGQWNPTTKTFTAGAGYPTPNAVQVTAQMTRARGTAIPTMFASILGSSSCNIHATSVATVVYPQQNAIDVPGTSDPWLAGMPDGTTADYYSDYGDCAPAESPTMIPGTLSSGQVLNFQFQGSVSNWSGDNTYGCNGDPDYVGCNWWAQSNGNAEHGIGNVTAPIASVIGIFLGPNEPDLSAAPAALDFSTLAEQQYSTISPLLKQPFFIGSGLCADGVTLKGIVVPPGATRLYIGCMDFQEWSDNSGIMTTTVTATPQVTLVN